MTGDLRLHVDQISKSFRGHAAMAVDGVSFSLSAGESLAVVGRNGAGKSTVLRIAAGILAPTTGSVSRVHRCASLIELGMGFHPDLTGRENLDLALVMAGTPRALRRRAAAETVEFAGIEQALDRQVKHYSSGMVARLACAIAVHSDPDLLLMDEVLAVGDASFQRRMLARIAELRRRGSALVLVTHSADLALVAAERALWINAGRPVAMGPAEEVLDAYETTAVGRTRYSTVRSVRIESVEVAPTRIDPLDPIEVRGTIQVEEAVDWIELRAEVRPVIGSAETWMRSPEEPPEHRHLNLMATSAPLQATDLAPGRAQVTFAIDALPITPTTVEVGLVAYDRQGRIIDHLGTELEIGASPRRPSYLLGLALGEAPGTGHGPPPEETTDDRR